MRVKRVEVQWIDADAHAGWFEDNPKDDTPVPIKSYGSFHPISFLRVPVFPGCQLLSPSHLTGTWEAMRPFRVSAYASSGIKVFRPA